MSITLQSAPVSGLVTLAEVKAVLDIADADTSRDDQLDRWITAFTARFEKDCQQPIRAATKVYSFRGSGYTGKELPFRNIQSITTLEYEGSFGTWTAIDSGDYELLGSDPCTLHTESPTCRSLQYRATLVVGYDNIPHDLVALAINAVVLDYLDSPLSNEGRLGKASTAISGTPGMAPQTISFSRDAFDKDYLRAVHANRRYW